MSTFMFKNKINDYTPISNIFIDNYMTEARGDFVKVYLLGLRYCMSGEIGISASMLASNLHLLETDVINAWNYWSAVGAVKFLPIDNMDNYNIEFIDFSNNILPNKETISVSKELSNNSTKEMLCDIEQLLSRPLSPKEMQVYISWLSEYDFKPELILLLIEYCVSKSKTDFRYIEKVALNWHEAKVNSIDLAQNHIKKFEDKWVNIRKVLTYLGMKDADVMKPQEDLLDKWFTTFNFSYDMICKACDICFERLNKAEFKYIDAILNSWNKDGIKTLSDLENKKSNKPYNKNSSTSYNKKSQDSFNDFQQRKYDYADLEKKLLGWDNND